MTGSVRYWECDDEYSTVPVLKPSQSDVGSGGGQTDCESRELVQVANLCAWSSSCGVQLARFTAAGAVIHCEAVNS